MIENHQANEAFYIKTYGCQMNVYDSQRINSVLSGMGYKEAFEPDFAKIIILNTCHIREKAAEKLYSDLGRIKKFKEKNDAYIAVIGCVAQAEGEEIAKRARIVDIITGPQSYHNLPELLQKAITKRSEEKELKKQKEAISKAKIRKKSQKILALDFAVEDKFDFLNKPYKSNNVSNFVTIQEGCDKFCRFCVVPYTRGPEVSRLPSDILQEVNILAEQGVKEITLLGQNVNAYAMQENGKLFALHDLVEEIAKIDNIKRIRFTTSHPRDMQQGLIDAFGECEKLMPYLHLPVQSGSNNILRDMNRGHDRDLYLEIIAKLRNKRPDIALSGDLIVGYPGETEEDFNDTMDIVKKVNYAQCYSFKYSRRPGTPASIMRNQIDEEVKKRRLEELQMLLNKQQFQFNKKFIGKSLSLLVVEKGKKDKQFVGKSQYLQQIVTDIDANIGDIIDVEIKRVTKNALYSF